MGLIVDCARSGERGFLDLEGVLDEEGAAELKRRAVHLAATGCNELVLSLERVSDIHPAALLTIAGIEALLPWARRSLAITGPAPKIRAELERAGLGELVEPSPLDDYPSEMFGITLVSSSA